MTDPQPTDEELDSLYSDAYRLHDPNYVGAGGGRLAAVIDQIRSLLSALYELRFGGLVINRRPRRSGRVLDIGFGTGTRLAALAEKGWSLYGLEVSDAAVASAHARLPSGSYRRGRVEEVDYESESFELILLYHVLEHLRDPVAVLRKVRGWLEPGGSIVLAVPVRNTAPQIVFGSSWYGYQLPEHLIHFENAQIRSVAAAANLEIRRMRPQDYFNGFADSMVNLFPALGAHPLSRAATKALFALPGIVTVLAGCAHATEAELVPSRLGGEPVL